MFSPALLGPVGVVGKPARGRLAPGASARISYFVAGTEMATNRGDDQRYPVSTVRQTKATNRNSAADWYSEPKDAISACAGVSIGPYPRLWFPFRQFPLRLF